MGASAETLADKELRAVVAGWGKDIVTESCRMVVDVDDESSSSSMVVRLRSPANVVVVVSEHELQSNISASCAFSPPKLNCTRPAAVTQQPGGLLDLFWT